jgi:hypothetical protein
MGNLLAGLYHIACMQIHECRELTSIQDLELIAEGVGLDAAEIAQ